MSANTHTAADRNTDSAQQQTIPRDINLRSMDFFIVQQCMHCGMCLPTCPTYDLTLMERHSPRGRIALMRAVAEEKILPDAEFQKEMNYCLGCLACQSACPAGVDYAQLFELSRADAERHNRRRFTLREAIRLVTLRTLFTQPRLLRLVGRALYFWQRSGLQWLLRKSKILHLFPARLCDLEAQTPVIQKKFSHQLIPAEIKAEAGSAQPERTVGLLTGCVQDLLYSDVNLHTAQVLAAAGCRVITPQLQHCCGSLHAHNGDLETSKKVARKLIDAFDLTRLDAIITNAAGCGSHLKHYDRLLADDPRYAEKARLWSEKLCDIHEYLTRIGYDPASHADEKSANVATTVITYHDACHLRHGQRIHAQPRALLARIPGLQLKELPEADWCCGSAGVYSITQPATARTLAKRKLDNIRTTGAEIIATANPGCLLHLQQCAQREGRTLHFVHPITLLAAALPTHPDI